MLKTALASKKALRSYPPSPLPARIPSAGRVNGEIWRNNAQFLHGGITGEYHSGIKPRFPTAPIMAYISKRVTSLEAMGFMEW